MFDAAARRVLDPPLNRIGSRLAARGVRADAVTVAGLGIGLAAAGAIVAGAWSLAVVLILVSRLADGLDGAVARVSGVTPFGGYLDIAADFVFYGAVPLAFVLHDPDANGVAGAALLLAFYINGATFLAYAAVAERLGLGAEQRARRSFLYSGGLLEGSETIVFFVALCLWPDAFPALAWIFAGLCLITAGLRTIDARTRFRDPGPMHGQDMT